MKIINRFLYSIWSIICLGCILHLHAVPFPLHEAATHGDLDRIKALYHTHKDLNLLNEHGYTVLYQAARSGNLDVVQFLVDNGADVNAANSNGCNKSNDRGGTPLHMAARKGNLDMVRFLQSKGAHVETMNYIRYTPLDEAAGKGREEVVQFLFSKGAPKDLFRSAITYASIKRHYSVERYLTEKGYTQDFNEGLVYKGIKEGNLKDVQDALASGIDKDVQDKNGRTLLHHAVYENSPDIVKFLIAAGANTLIKSNDEKTPFTMQNAFGRTFVHELARKGDLAFLTLLVEKYRVGVKVVDAQGSPLHGAAEKNKGEIITWLLAHGADYSLGNNELHGTWMTPLHTAAKHGNSEIIKLLVEQYKVNTNPIDRRGMTPLHYAARRGDFTSVKFLLEQNEVRIFQSDRKGRTALHLAARSGNVELMKLLSKWEGADLLHQDMLRRTCLHYAAKAKKNGLALIEFLLQQSTTIKASSIG